MGQGMGEGMGEAMGKGREVVGVWVRVGVREGCGCVHESSSEGSGRGTNWISIWWPIPRLIKDAFADDTAHWLAVPYDALLGPSMDPLVAPFAFLGRAVELDYALDTHRATSDAWLPPPGVLLLALAHVLDGL